MLVVDDQELVRSGFCVILEAADGITVVGEAGNGEAAVAAVAAHHPDVVLMDIRMPGMDGLEATRLITRDASAAPKVVMLTTFDLDDYVYEALRAGASGFLLKDSPRHDLIAAVRAAAAGDALLAPSVTRRLIEAFARRPPETAPSPSRLASLTARERDVLLLLARGRSNAEIAPALFVSEATVKTHVGNVLAKLGLRDRVQAVILAYETGMVVPGDQLSGSIRGSTGRAGSAALHRGGEQAERRRAEFQHRGVEPAQREARAPLLPGPLAQAHDLQLAPGVAAVGRVERRPAGLGQARRTRAGGCPTRTGGRLPPPSSRPCARRSRRPAG